VRRSLVAGVLAAAAVGLLCACGPSKPAVDPEPAAPETVPPPPAPPPPPPAPSLYERLGKRDALEGVVEELVGNVLADNRINKLFDKVKKDKERAKQLRARLVAELCVVAGGDDCNYDGKPMKDAHKGMNIGDAQWNAFAEDLSIALKTRNIDDALAKELMDKLESATKGDIVTGGGKGR
jgi:hemoglobin